MTFDRSSGVFLHLTALPGPDGVGTLGAPAHDFVDALAAADQSLWQFCPLGPTAGGFGNSPYQAYSAFAGNPLLVDLEALRAAGWLTDADLADRPDFDEHWVEYDRVNAYKTDRLRRAFERFRTTATDDDRAALDAFAAANAAWLDDYALFRALQTAFDDDGWTSWPAAVRERDPDTLSRYRDDLADEIELRVFCQFCFDRQWRALHEHANERGVSLVGDMPIYMGLDSADVWANPDLFDLDEANEPAAVAGMPTNPDGHGEGQRWGNPLYDWDAMRAEDYAWWVRRFESLLDRVDVVRVDHFKGYEQYWAIPAGTANPADGEWRDGPGEALFEAVEAALGDLPLVVEDLGGVTPELRAFRKRLGLPGMKVALYADWCAEDHEYLPHRYPEDSVAYTSTHDTTTVVGWYEDVASDRQRDCLQFALDTDGSAVHWDVIEAVWATDSVFAIAPFQDLLGLGGETRFNTPGTADGNWTWRLTRSGLADDAVWTRLSDMTEAHRRD
ncbi:4-alpha-glucanotransferase [Halomicroarcula sp. GCM10025817]|uniref:4-alpha-glucanotransferase n=1 Tax=Haloarcula TaxID=2237 RepID=UPI0023E8F819|nr:4-alpha-glucanotransferase [Halomicroarcula sp. SYNS111]